MKGREYVFLAGLLASLFMPLEAAAQCTVPGLGTGASGGEEIRYVVVVDGSPEFVTEWQNAVSHGINERWNSNCLDGVEAPRFVAGTPSAYDVKIVITDQDPNQYPNVEDGSCGAHLENVGPNNDEEWIVLFPVGLSDCSDDQRNRVATHELGHPLGLGENTTCGTDHIMVASATATNSDIHSAECQKVHDIWGDEEPDPPGECRPGACEDTPLVFDVDGDRHIPTTNVDSDLAVLFDLDADGLLERVGWLADPFGDAFLWLDVDGNGSVTDGSELFGSATRLPDGNTAENGFEALAIYDRPEFGGNGDGMITPSDHVWSSLRLWFDVNYNGVSEPGEISSMDEHGIVAVSLNYARNEWIDDQGNIHTRRSMYWALREQGRGVRPGLIEDIVFLMRDQ